jgi:hypothetical protein
MNQNDVQPTRQVYLKNYFTIFADFFAIGPDYNNGLPG